ncbi:MAG: hypothetical protein AAF639_36580 [Chloroflexota bacterium]
MKNQLTPLEDMTENLFVGREEELEDFWEWGTNIPAKFPHNSFALVGRRRTGKTTILTKLFNRLFDEQEEVLPVFITFSPFLNRKKTMTSYELAKHYFSGYVRSYLAFRYREPLFFRQNSKFEELYKFAQQVDDEFILGLYKRYQINLKSDIPFDLVDWVINFPRGEAAIHEMPTAMIVDEFQVLTNVYDPTQNVYHDYTDSFQQAAETRHAPMLVSGSAVSLLVSQALTGMLHGRIVAHHLEPLSREETHDLVFRIGDDAGIEATDELAEMIWRLTDGYPYSVHALMRSRCGARKQLPSLDALQTISNFEVRHQNAILAQHYGPEIEKYSERLNDGPTTRRVMLWVTKYPNQFIDAEMASEELGIDEKVAREALEKLRWIDIIEKTGIISYTGPKDPMLRRYIEYQHYTEIEKLGPEKSLKDWEEEYKSLLGTLSNIKGELGEMYVRMIMTRFAGQVVQGSHFNHDNTVQLPHFDTIERRGGTVERGIKIELDIIGEYKRADEDTRGAWIVEVKYTQERIGADLIRHFINNSKTFQAKTNYAAVTHWYFSKSGFTKDAIKLLASENILYNDWKQFRLLARQLGYLGLPLN